MRIATVGFLVFFSAIGVAAIDPLLQAAEYYYSRHDYRQAYQLWTEVYKGQEDQLLPTLRMAELRLLFETRTSAIDTLRKFLDRRKDEGGYGSEPRHQIREKWESLASTFLTDEGQTLYYQAQPKLKASEWQGALTLLQSARIHEHENIRLLKDIARCERGLKLWDSFYKTVQTAMETAPFDSEIRDWCFESHAYFGKPQIILSEAKRVPSTLLTGRQRLAIGYAISESGSLSESVTVLEPLIIKERAGFHPIALYVMGKALSRRADRLGEASSYLDRFLSFAAQPNRCLIEGWDPYRCADRVEDAKRILGTLKANPTQRG